MSATLPLTSTSIATASVGLTLPPLAPIRRVSIPPTVADPEAELVRLIRGSRLSQRVAPGGTIALGIGSRGITTIPRLARAAVTTLKEMGYRVFIVAAMGSHGGATPEGQRRLLADYGITEQAMGVEIRTDMETERLGTNRFGLPIFFDRNALGADGIVLLNRIKPHTDFVGRYESGILKMLTIGLGKRQGAEQIHKLGLRGMKELLPEVGAFLIERTPFALGLAVIENADDLPAEIVALEKEEVLDREPALLERARALMGRLPFDQIDVLVVGELGKNYSGAGMDPNVLGRLMVETQADFERPKVTRLVVLDVSDESHGNIVGVGFADLTTERLVAKMDPVATRINVLTSCFLERARVPITLASDRAVFEEAVKTCWRLDPAECRLVVIPNTLELARQWVSPALKAEVEASPDWAFDGPFQEIPFDDSGTLDQAGMFPESVRGRRRRTAHAYASAGHH